VRERLLMTLCQESIKVGAQHLLINSDRFFLALVIGNLLNDLLHHSSMSAGVDAGERHVQMRVCLDSDSLLGVILGDILKDL